MTTLTEALAALRSVADEEVARFYTDVELTRWINEAIKDIARRTELFQTRADIPVVANTQEYVLPVDCIRINRLEFTQTGDSRVVSLDYRDVGAMDEVWWSARTSSKGRPAFYTLWGSPPSLAALLWPTPSVSGSLKVWYYQQPAETTAGGSTLPIPMGWDDALTDYAEYRALRKARDPRWQEAKQLYEEKVAELFEKTRRFTDQSGSSFSGGGGGPLPGWLTDW